MGKKVQMRFHKRWSPIQIFSFGIGILAVLVFIFFYTFRLEEIQFDECDYYTKEELLEYFKQEQWDNNTILFYTKIHYRNEIEIPFIQKIDIKYVNKNTVKIELYEKSIVGCVEYMNEYIYFDKDGKVLEISKDRVEEIPLFYGLNFSEMKLYDYIAISDMDMFTRMKDISQLIQRYELPIDKVLFDTYQNVTLYTNDIKVLLGNRTTYDEQIAEFSSIYPKIAELKGELDLKNFTPGQEQIIFRETQ